MGNPVPNRLRGAMRAVTDGTEGRRRGDGAGDGSASTGVAFESATSRNRIGTDGYDAVLAAGNEGSEPVTIDEVVDRVVEAEADLTGWSAVHERLYFVDLPALDAEGAIEFNPDSGIVELPEEA